MERETFVDRSIWTRDSGEFYLTRATRRRDDNNGCRAYLEGRLGSELLESMSQRSRTAMEKSWEEQVKFKFGTPAQNRSTIFEVVVPGVPDDDDLDIEEGFHTMTKSVKRSPRVQLRPNADTLLVQAFRRFSILLSTRLFDSSGTRSRQ